MLKFFNVTGVKALRKNSDLVHININELERTFVKEDYNKDFLYKKFNYSDI